MSSLRDDLCVLRELSLRDEEKNCKVKKAKTLIKIYLLNRLRLLFIVFNFTFMYYVYITTNPTKTTLYIGVTNDLKRRMSEHKKQRGIWKHFSGRYYCYNLIYFEEFETPRKAINREKELKKLTREKKFDLIKLKNPDLSFYKL